MLVQLLAGASHRLFAVVGGQCSIDRLPEELHARGSAAAALQDKPPEIPQPKDAPPDWKKILARLHIAADHGIQLYTTS